MFLKLRQNSLLFFQRILMGSMLLVLLGNGYLPLAALTLKLAEGCQMECCKSSRLRGGNSSGESCSLMSKKSASHESLSSAANAHKESDSASSAKHLHEETDTTKSQPEKTSEEKLLIASEAKTPNHNHSAKEDFSYTRSDDPDRSQNILFLDVIAAARCDQPACGASSFSAAGKRQSQSHYNCLLLSFAEKPRPSIFILTKIGTTCFNRTFKEQIRVRRFSVRAPPAVFS